MHRWFLAAFLVQLFLTQGLPLKAPARGGLAPTIGLNDGNNGPPPK